MTTRLMAIGRPVYRAELVSLVSSVASEVLGKKPKRHQAPWLRGHEVEKEALEAELEQTKMKWALSSDEEAATSLAAKRVGLRRRRLLREWERVWMEHPMPASWRRAAASSFFAPSSRAVMASPAATVTDFDQCEHGQSARAPTRILALRMCALHERLRTGDTWERTLLTWAWVTRGPDGLRS
eukprot:9481206-Pyramimonas_sp.AAC.2